MDYIITVCMDSLVKDSPTAYGIYQLKLSRCSQIIVLSHREIIDHRVIARFRLCGVQESGC